MVTLTFGLPLATAALPAVGEPFGGAARREPLHVDDLVVADGEDHEALLVALARRAPRCRPNDLVADLHELRVDPSLAPTTLPALELQDLPGLVRTASTRRVLPPQVPAGDAPPFAVLVDQSDERFDIPVVECGDRGPQLVDHQRIVDRPDAIGDASLMPVHPQPAPRGGCLDVAQGKRETEPVARYRVSVRVWPVASCRPLNGRDTLSARRVVLAPCAQRAACEFAAPYVEAGLVVDWTVRRAGVRRFGRGWSGRFVPDDGDDGAAGVREPRRPRPSAGDAAVALDPPAA